MIVRQGDVLVFSAAVPSKAKKADRDGKRIVLALGEVTGHAHAILDREVELYSVADQVDRWLRVGPGGATIQHEEHGAIMLPPGEYQVRIQRDYSPESIRNQAD